VARLLAKEMKEPLTAVGLLAGVPVGSRLVLEGSWSVDARFGRQFKVRQYRIVKPNTLQGIERYLGSGLIKGVGPGFAARIVKHFGLATLDILEQDPDRLHEVAGLGAKRIETVKQAWIEQRSIHRIMVFLQGYGISATYAVKIFKTYGTKAQALVEENPYRLAEDIWGIGFKSADRIAASVGITGNDPRRARAGLLFLLNQATEEGHCYLPQAELLARGHSLLDLAPEVLAAQLPGLVSDARVVISGDNIYLSAMLHAERGTAREILRLVGCAAAKRPEQQEAREVDRAERSMGISFAPEQKQALRTALQSKVTLLTGGPGTGKSTILRALAEILQARNLSLLQCAPTGRAAKRLAEATGREAKTIHRLLEFDPSTFGFRHNSDNRLPTDFVVVDEVSMLDVVLAHSLVKALPDKASLVLVGDVDQLPSVGPGNVLRDLIDSGVLPVIRLVRIYRQGEGSLISLNAHRINAGEPLELLPDFHGEKDFYCIFRQTPEEIEAEVLSLMSGRLQDKFGFDPLRDIQVLCPMRRGLVGTEHLNLRLQAVFSREKPQPDAQRLQAGDKVMQIRNNYDKEVFNGDIGFVHSVDPESEVVRVFFDDRQLAYEASELRELELAFAITIHKSQGSEFPCVVLPLHTVHYPLLQRNLLYTGVTRGKRLVVLIGSKKALAIAVKNSKVDQRFTDLRGWVRQGKIDDKGS